MLAESLLALATAAGQTVVDAAAAGEWETAQHGFAKVIGRGDAEQTQLAGQRLEETRELLSGAAATDVDLLRVALAVRWTGRLADLLEENPAVEADLRALVEELRAVPEAVPQVGTDAAGEPGPEDPGTLAARSELAYSAGQAGDAAGARDQFTELLPVAERVLGPEHPDTLTNRHNLANFAGYAGDAGAARDQFAALVPVAERVLGPGHPDTLAARASLAYWTGQAGNPAGARDQFAALLPVRERASGPDHPDTLAAREELANWTGRAGNAAAARDQFASLLRMREKALGPQHAETMAVWYQLAYWTALAGDA